MIQQCSSKLVVKFPTYTQWCSSYTSSVLATTNMLAGDKEKIGQSQPSKSAKHVGKS